MQQAFNEQAITQQVFTEHTVMEIALQTQSFTWLIVVFATLFGLVIGSFLNLVIWRHPPE
jgi:uncharacterized membrane protein YqgA involved in biofilm formation